MILAELAAARRREAQDVETQVRELLADRLLVQDADDRVLAVHGRHDRDAEVDGAAGMRSLKRPSCGMRFSAMSSSAMTLMRQMIGCGAACRSAASPAAARRRCGT